MQSNEIAHNDEALLEYLKKYENITKLMLSHIKHIFKRKIDNKEYFDIYFGTVLDIKYSYDDVIELCPLYTLMKCLEEVFSDEFGEFKESILSIREPPYYIYDYVFNDTILNTIVSILNRKLKYVRNEDRYKVIVLFLEMKTYTITEMLETIYQLDIHFESEDTLPLIFDPNFVSIDTMLKVAHKKKKYLPNFQYIFYIEMCNYSRVKDTDKSKLDKICALHELYRIPITAEVVFIHKLVTEIETQYDANRHEYEFNTDGILSLFWKCIIYSMISTIYRNHYIDRVVFSLSTTIVDMLPDKYEIHIKYLTQKHKPTDINEIVVKKIYDNIIKVQLRGQVIGVKNVDCIDLQTI
jgi:hypothetical protein